MSTTSEALKQARHEVLAGGDRQAIFEKYRGTFSRPVKLAMTIANIPKGPISTLARILNAVLLVLLILAAILKTLGIIGMLGQGVPPVALIGIVLLGLVVPVVFAIAVAKWEGQVYMILPILCLLGILNTWMKSSTLEAAFDTIFLLAIAGLAVAVKLLVFPSMGFLGLKKDGHGGFVF